MTREESLEKIANRASVLINVLMMAWGSHYPGGMTEAWNLEQALKEHEKLWPESRRKNE